jgi:hypothetical protein
VLALPPYIDPRDRVITPLKFLGWNSTPDCISYQLENRPRFIFPDMGKYKHANQIVRM